MDRNDSLRVLTDRVVDDMCVAFIGAGVSASFEYEGRTYLGLPLARELLALAKAERDYLAETNDLGQAMLLMRSYEGRPALESFIRSHLGQRRAPLPCHRSLANLRFSCYVSMNFDTLLEDAIEEASIPHLPIVRDTDVPLLKPDSVPVIKPHGSIEQLDTICVATDETLDFKQNIPIISSLLIALLAQKTVLFLGFSLSDSDFIGLVRELKRSLGNYMPKSFAVVRERSKFLEKFWDEHGVRVLEDDATTFLRDLEDLVRKRRYQLEEDLEPWQKNPFFWELLEIRSLPTETQVLEALLNEVRRRIADGENIASIKSATLEAVELVLTFRKNFSALRVLGVELEKLFGRVERGPETAWEEFSVLESSRRSISERINHGATTKLGSARRVVLYSQSQRVVDFLSAVAPSIQREVTLFICECRPKSPKPFQDALSTAKLLRSTQYKLRLVPDMACLHLISKREVDLVLMGAHAVYLDDNSEPTFFVNTCGSEGVACLAETYNVPVNIVYENEKAIKTQGKNVEGISFDEEENIAKQVVGAIAGDGELAERIRILNVGYDLVPWRANMISVTD